MTLDVMVYKTVGPLGFFCSKFDILLIRKTHQANSKDPDQKLHYALSWVSLFVRILKWDTKLLRLTAESTTT